MAKKKRYTIDELNAYKVAYGRPIAREDYVLNLLLPAFFGGGMTFLLLNKWWISLPVACIYAFYGYRVLLPLNVHRFYRHKAFDQRNRFINNLTQLLSDPTVSWFVALQRASERCEGEFRDDLDQLLVSLQDASSAEIGEHFRTFTQKYHQDVVFSLYMEQVETIAIEGRTGIAMLRDIKTYHNYLREQTKQFIQQKKRVVAQGQLCLLLSVLFLGAFHYFPMGFDNYLNSFAYAPVGWVTSGLYLLVLTLLLHQVCRQFYDDEVMEVEA